MGVKIMAVVVNIGGRGRDCGGGVCVHLVLNYVLNLKLYWIILRHQLNFIDNI